MKNPQKALREVKQLTPGQISRLRTQLFHHLEKQVPDANDVVMGKKTWTNQQVNLFKLFLNKAVPDVSENYHLHNHELKKPTEYTREELENIVFSPDEAVTEDAEFSDVNDLAEGVTEPVTNQEG